MERFIQGGLAVTGQAQTIHSDINERLKEVNKPSAARASYIRITQAKCKTCDYTPKLHTVSLDIECSERGELYSIGLDSPKDSRVIMIGDMPQGEHTDKSDTPIEWVSDEKSPSPCAQYLV